MFGEGGECAFQSGGLKLGWIGGWRCLSVALYDWIGSDFVGITGSCCRRPRDRVLEERLSHQHPRLGSNPSPWAVPFRIMRILEMKLSEHVSLIDILSLDQVSLLRCYHMFHEKFGDEATWTCLVVWMDGYCIQVTDW